MSEPTPITPDTKDWTFVITAGCSACGFEPHDPAETGHRLRMAAPRWEAVLRREDVRERPAPTTWSALEYGCHVRDAAALFGARLSMMLHRDGAEFDNWDQDAQAIRDRYDLQDPDEVAPVLVEELGRTADLFDTVTGPLWDHRGTRSNGSQFTIRTFALYFTHDVEHHLHDVNG